MQITINIPDNLSQEVIEKYIAELEEKLKQLQEIEEFKIDESACLDALAKINRGDKSGMAEIGNVKDYIRTRYGCKYNPCLAVRNSCRKGGSS